MVTVPFYKPETTIPTSKKRSKEFFVVDEER
jgi:hypothetical protein